MHLNNSESFQIKLARLHESLGIGPEFMEQCTMPLCVEPEELVSTEPDFYQRPQQLIPAAFSAWTEMKQAAKSQGVEIFLISAFRGAEYQHDLIAKKLEAGQSLEQVLAVNAAPGFSEHHTGRAVDIGTSNCPALVTEFENTKAFQWLATHAADFSFTMTYPPDNPFGIDYEPWHWCFNPDSSQV